MKSGMLDDPSSASHHKRMVGTRVSDDPTMTQTTNLFRSVLMSIAWQNSGKSSKRSCVQDKQRMSGREERRFEARETISENDRCPSHQPAAQRHAIGRWDLKA
jgi:hypothetical protein